MKTIQKEKDVMVRIAKDTRYKLKMRATKLGLTLKEFLKEVGNQKI